MEFERAEGRVCIDGANKKWRQIVYVQFVGFSNSQSPCCSFLNASSFYHIVMLQMIYFGIIIRTDNCIILEMFNLHFLNARLRTPDVPDNCKNVTQTCK